MSILDFKKQIKENKERIKLNIGLGTTLSPYPINTFYLASYFSGQKFSIGQNSYQPLIKLDEEDIDYFKNKYFKKLDEEMEKEVNKVKQQYE